jgi:hypothetical protein
LLQYGLRVATTSGEKHEKSWNGQKSAITLHQKSEMIQFFDFMIQITNKGLILSTFRGAYYISPAPAETE